MESCHTCSASQVGRAVVAGGRAVPGRLPLRGGDDLTAALRAWGELLTDFLTDAERRASRTPPALVVAAAEVACLGWLSAVRVRAEAPRRAPLALLAHCSREATTKRKPCAVTPSVWARV